MDNKLDNSMKTSMNNNRLNSIVDVEAENKKYLDNLRERVYNTYIHYFTVCYCCKISNISEDTYYPFLYNPFGPKTLLNIRPLCVHCALFYNGECLADAIRKRRSCVIENCGKNGYSILDQSWKCEEHHMQVLSDVFTVDEVYQLKFYIQDYQPHQNDKKMLDEYIRDYKRWIEHNAVLGCAYSGCSENAHNDSRYCPKHKDDTYEHLENALNDSAKALRKYDKLKKKYEEMKQENMVIVNRLTTLEEIIIRNKLE